MNIREKKRNRRLKIQGKYEEDKEEGIATQAKATPKNKKLKQQQSLAFPRLRINGALDTDT